MELDDRIHQQIVKLCSKGDQLFEKSQFDPALEEYTKALELLPNPKSNWEASVWVYTAIGDSHFCKKDFQKAADAFYDAYNGPEAVTNPFINLRLGQSLFELDQMDKAEDFLLRAYMLEGLHIFDSENEKYLDYMRRKYDL